jgi:hypothetical protein
MGKKAITNSRYSDKYLKDKIVIPIDRGVPLSESIKMGIRDAKQRNVPLDKDIETLGDFFDISTLIKNNKGTSIPFFPTLYGKFLLNPSTISAATYQKMQEKNPTIRRCQELNVATIVAGVSDYYHDDKKIQELGRHALQVVKGGKNGLLKDACTCMAYGHYNGQKEKFIDNKGRTLIKNVRFLPASTIAYTVNAYGDIEDIWQYVYGFLALGMQNAFSSLGAYGGYGGYGDGGFMGNDSKAAFGNLDYPFRSNFINTMGLVQLERKNIIHMSFDNLQGNINHYGHSLLANCYDDWLKEALINKQHTIAMARRANPMLIAYAHQRQTVELPDFSMPAIDWLSGNLQDYTTNSAIVVPGLKGELFDFDSVKIEGDFKLYIEGLQYSKTNIESVHFIPEGLFSSGASFAAATAQNSVYIRKMDSIKDDLVEEVLLNQFMRTIIEENFGKDVQDMGRFESHLQNIDDKLKYAKILESMVNLGFLSNQQAEDVQRGRKSMGEPEASPELLKVLIETNKKKELKDSMDNTDKVHTKEANNHYKNRSQGSV